MRRATIATAIAALVCASVTTAQDEAAASGGDVLLAVAPVPSHATNELRLAATSLGTESANELALAAIPGGSVNDAVLGALPPPPKTVVRTTRMFGTVTVTHAKHLERRVKCVSCHGPGPVTKITFTPQVAHDRCRGCHVQLAKGPTDCRGCHVVPPPAPPPAAIASAPEAKPTPPPALPPPPPPPSEDARSGFTKIANVGMSVLMGTGGTPRLGPSVELLGRSGGHVVTYTLATQGGNDHGRTRMLVAGGKALELRPSLTGALMAVGGVDALAWGAATQAVLGARLGLELRTRAPVFRTVEVSLIGLKGLGRPLAAADDPVPDLTMTLTVAAGLQLGR